MVRRTVLTLAVVAMVAAIVITGPDVTVGGVQQSGTNAASAQPGAPDYCGPWQQAWFVSSGGWWYHWWWRWCHNPSIQGGWYVDWAGWEWYSPAPPGLSPGFQYTGPPPPR
jgi:hypothetical protein